jgi:hypothetical protein
MMVMPVAVTVVPGMGHRWDGGEDESRGQGRGKSYFHGITGLLKGWPQRASKRGRPRLSTLANIRALG